MKKDIQISLRVYSENKIKQAIEDISSSVEISFSNGILTIIGDSQQEIDEIFHEFMNYVLSL